MGESNLKRWFQEKWVDEHGNECGSSKNKKIKKCRPSKRINDNTPVTWGEMTDSQKRKAVKEKKKVGMGKRTTSIKKSNKSPVKPKGKVFNPYTGRYVNKEGTTAKKYNLGKYKMSPTKKKDACYYKVKSRFKVWPSAYGSGALVKCRNVGAENWGNKKKSNKNGKKK